MSFGRIISPFARKSHPPFVPAANERRNAGTDALSLRKVSLMIKSAIQPKTEYALREKRSPDAPIQRVRVIEHVRRNKWRVEWVDPNPGLVDYVESGQLIAPWKGLKAFLKEEENERRLREYNDSHGYD